MKKIFQLFIGYVLLSSLCLIVYSKTLVLFNIPSNVVLIVLLFITLIIIRIRPKDDAHWYQFKIIINRVHFD
ncbi:hypothetical protein PCL88_09510 [Staphylococcus aureus]|nr:hypothetical protein PCL88_09510 [Staphylococcus aureus]